VSTDNSRSFFVDAMCAGYKVGRVSIRLTNSSDTGEVVYTTGHDDPRLAALSEQLLRWFELLEEPDRRMSWNEFTRRLSLITMTSGGRFVFRYYETPSMQGRNGDNTLKSVFERAIRS
jgi:hypothetical protein